ncbi:hypothetical protein Pan216_37570 [Planctomycetes bacterium Pan216]|uniref:Zinc-finger domain-containing protein n=1 Tax=Kolteria novifilia TaxID=2527975 RepID=A0A518B7D8_9BACT|nr:hypothetical protein Pan216_37570 [Planctomycetes bacterium Pan216]
MGHGFTCDSGPNRVALVGYLEEALSNEELARVEQMLRTRSEWREALRDVTQDMDPGEHSVATIWRRHRLTCPTRERLGAYLLQALAPEETDYVRFHLDVIGCRWCQANLDDLSSTVETRPSSDMEHDRRRRRLFETSVGHLPRRNR